MHKRFISHGSLGHAPQSVLACIRFLTVLLSVAATIWLAAESGLRDPGDYGSEQIGVSTHVGTTMVALEGLADGVSIEDECDVDSAEESEYPAQAFTALTLLSTAAFPAVTEPTAHDTAVPVPFRLRAFAGRAPPTI